MHGLVWNARGLGQLRKKKFLQDTIRDRWLSFVGIQETKKVDFQLEWLNSLTGHDLFIWHWIPSIGQSSGILLGVSECMYEIGECEKGDYHIRMLLHDKCSGFKCNLVVVYGAPHYKDKAKKLVELVQVLGCNSFPFMLGGDKGIRHSKWSNLFNGIIEHWALQELDLYGRSFTWSNNQEDPLFEKLDRILVSSGWISTHPLATVIALNRRVSDHNSLLVTYGLSANYVRS
ncbi:hypothetical protein BRADI_4g25857v3 [Brachypodium distachyon]|uniref:Endonuclease/exonuclease/phosphatase domain-containing protein n=1 Tax=Brachypodium distachyon TaxID=15368 RepID=A0A2K2CQ77_BRADI|nr:hypothetical protein BRADI_4g25857v3 [Brachypodium distachyon]